LIDGIMVDGQLAMTAIVHRDSDFMDEKKKKWAKLYRGMGSTRGSHPAAM
jgi:hypothetical protein